MESSFNLIDEPWIPVSGKGLLSLMDIFADSGATALAGTPVQKAAVLKLLLAIAQAAYTPGNKEEWSALSSADLGGRCRDYLLRWRDAFWLYGDRPFLQHPIIKMAAKQPYGAVQLDVATGNTTTLFETQIERSLENSEKALLLLAQMGFALGGKKTDNSVVLTPGYAGKFNDKGKASTGKPGPSIGFMGFLHSFLLGQNLLETIRLNLLAQDQISSMSAFEDGLGVPPWEQMPEGEDCPVAKSLKSSLMGRLVPLCRFCLLADDGIHLSEGILHPGYKDGMVDPSVAVKVAGKDVKALWVNPEKRPWRELTALLSFLGEQKSDGFQSWQLRSGLSRLDLINADFAIWSGGVAVSSNAGEQYLTGTDDFVESVIWLSPDILGSFWLEQLKSEMEGLNLLEKGLYAAVAGYFKKQLVDGSALAAQSTNTFWQLAEREFPALIEACGNDSSSAGVRAKLRRKFSAIARQSFDQFCPRETARQLDAWASSLPNHKKYLSQEA